MLFFGSNLFKSAIFNNGAAEAAFYPWWDTLQDFVIYTKIIIGEYHLSEDKIFHNNLKFVKMN